MTTKKLFLAFLLLVVTSWPSFSFATSGCCSHHGGVCGCNTSTGSQSCCDGTDSPSCGCEYIPPKTTSTPTSSSNSTYSLETLSYGQLLSDIAKCNNEKKTLSDSVASSAKEIKTANATISEKNKKISNQSDDILWLVIGCIILFFTTIHYYRKSKANNKI